MLDDDIVRNSAWFTMLDHEIDDLRYPGQYIISSQRLLYTCIYVCVYDQKLIMSENVARITTKLHSLTMTIYMVIVSFHDDFSPSSEQPEQRKSSHML